MEVEPPKRKRRWFQFSLRTLLIFVLVCAVGSAWLGVIAKRANRQRVAVETIKKAGGTVYYDYQADADGVLRFPPSSPAYPEWLKNGLGVDYFSNVVRVSLNSRSDAGSFEALSDLPHLGSVWLAGRNVTDSVLARTTTLSQLHALIVSNSAITATGWESLEHLPQLKMMNLQGSTLTDSVLLHIKSLTGLKRLFLDSPQITDSGLTHIMALSQLEELGLIHCPVTDNGLQQLKTMTNLKKLLIAGTKTSVAGVKDLSRALPTLAIRNR